MEFLTDYPYQLAAVRPSPLIMLGVNALIGKLTTDLCLYLLGVTVSSLSASLVGSALVACSDLRFEVLLPCFSLRFDVLERDWELSRP